MQKTFVLDTNVLLQSPHALFAFGNNKLVIPEVVLEELDRFKRDRNDLGSNARQVARLLDKYREKGKLQEGVPLENGGLLKVELNHQNVELPSSWNRQSADNRIIQVCKGLIEEGEEVYLISKDVFERIKADALDVTAQDFFHEQVPVWEEQYQGRTEVFISREEMNEFFEDKEKGIDPEAVKIYNSASACLEVPELVVNQFIVLHALENTKQSTLCYFDGHRIRPLKHSHLRPFGVNPKNVGQKFFQEALYRGADEAPLVIAKGPAGTAKTFLSLAVGLDLVMNCPEKPYRKILFCRPNVTMDEDIGFLPGTENEKLAPLFRGVRDNLEILLDNDDERRYESEIELHDKVEEIFARNFMTTEAVAFLRGRSIARQYVIIDEAQNLTPKQAKAIITRAGQGTKIVMLGDPEQIDHAFLDSRTNGLSFASERMKGSRYCWQIALSESECERSAISSEAAHRM